MEQLTSDELIQTITGMLTEADPSIMAAVTGCTPLMQYLLQSGVALEALPSTLGLFLSLGIQIGMKVSRRRIEIAELERL